MNTNGPIPIQHCGLLIRRGPVTLETQAGQLNLERLINGGLDQYGTCRFLVFHSGELVRGFDSRLAAQQLFNQLAG